jgi:hypothetical protein
VEKATHRKVCSHGLDLSPMVFQSTSVFSEGFLEFLDPRPRRSFRLDNIIKLDPCII